MVVKMLPKIVRRKDPIELNYRLHTITLKSIQKTVKFGSLVGATVF